MSLDLLSLMSAKTNSINGMPRGGKPVITWEMVAQVLSKLPGHISAYARMKYNGEYEGNQYGQNFHKALDALRCSGACKNIMDNMQASKYMKMTKVVLLEEITEGQICPVCNGVGSRTINSGYVDCELCMGVGRVKFTKRQIAETIGYCDARSFNRHGEDHYNSLRDEISIYWEGAIRRACASIHKE